MSTYRTSIFYSAVRQAFEVMVDGETIGHVGDYIAGEAMAAQYLADEAAAKQRELELMEREAGVVEACINPARITRRAVGAALRQARQAAADDRLVTALNKAAVELEVGGWQFDGQGLVINSRSTRGQRYHVTRDRCTCIAAQHNHPCWHVSAFDLLATAAQLDRAA